ncbi:MAG: hypothetical protein L0G70_10230, partial [Rubrobacter sp.]|nr:hypothetical protein [Rubrobacter sp.]
MLAQNVLEKNDIQSPADAGSAFFDKVPAWIDSATAMAESAASNPMVMAVGTLCVAGLVTTTIGGPRVLRQAAGAVCSDPSDLYVGARDGGKLFGKLPVRLGWEDRCTGFRITGPTGSGKTTAAVPFAMDDLLCGRDVFVLETHGDLGTEIRKRAAALSVDILSCDASEALPMFWNPLAGENTEDVANRLSAAIASSLHYHGFYGPMGESIVRNFVKLAREYKQFCKQEEPSEANWDLLNCLITDNDFLHEILETTTSDGKKKSSSNRYVVGATWLTQRTRAWFDGKFLAWSEDRRNEYRAEVATLFERLDNSRAAKHMLLPGGGRERLDLYEELNRPLTGAEAGGHDKSAFRQRLGRLIVVRAPVSQTGMGDSAARTIAYLALKTVIDATVERAAPETHVKPLSIFLDEMPKLMGRAGEETQHEVAGWLTLVRDKNCAPHLLFLSHALMPKILLNALDATCRNFLIMPGASADEVEFYRKTAGVVETEVTDSRTSYSRGGKTHSEGSHMAEKKRLAFDEIKYLKRGEAIYMGVKDNADEIPVKVATRRAPEP